MSDMPAICGAIRSQRVVSCVYDRYERTVHPLVLLMNNDQEYVLHCWQVGGATSSGRSIPCWSNFKISEISRFQVTPDHFSSTPPDYNPDRFENIVCMVPNTR